MGDGPCNRLDVRIHFFPAPWPGVDAFAADQRVSAWKAPADFEFHCPDHIDEAAAATVAAKEEERDQALASIAEDIRAARAAKDGKAFEAAAHARSKAEKRYADEIAVLAAKVRVSHGGTVRGPKGWWVVRQGPSYWVVAPDACEPVAVLRAALERAANEATVSREYAEEQLRAAEAWLVSIEAAEPPNQQAIEEAHVAAEKAESVAHAARERTTKAEADLAAFNQKVR